MQKGYDMNEFTNKERLTAMLVLQLIDENVQQYANPEDQDAAMTAVLSLAMDMHRDGIDRTFVNQLEYPDAKV
jgi:hypothetical protein